jgi:hypothetical protein
LIEAQQACMRSMEATLEMTAKEAKHRVRELLNVPDAPALNPFGPDSDTNGDAGGNHFAQNTRYLNGHATGNFKAAQYLAAYGNLEGVCEMVLDTRSYIAEERPEVADLAPVANFLVSVYVEKHGWKAGLVEEAAARRFAEEIGASVVEYETPARAAKNESRQIDRTLVTDDGERVTVQVKTNSNKKVNAEAVDYVLRVDAEIDNKEITVEAEKN